MQTADAAGRPSAQIEAVGATLALDLAAARIVEHLRRHGAEVVLLKGLSTQRMLYRGWFRSYGDVDLLASPAQWDLVIDGLRGLGYRDATDPPNDLKHARVFVGSHRTVVDLHRSLIGVGVEPQRGWAVLSQNVQEMTVYGEPVNTLTPGALLAVLALHAAQHGTAEAKPLADLRFAVELMPLPTWEAAARIAGELKATDAFVAGLRLVDGGRELSIRLGLPHPVSMAAHLRAVSAPRAAYELASILSPGSGRWRVLRRILAPTDAELVQRARARHWVGRPGGWVLSRAVWFSRVACELPRAACWYGRERLRRRQGA